MTGAWLSPRPTNSRVLLFFLVAAFLLATGSSISGSISVNALTVRTLPPRIGMINLTSVHGEDKGLEEDALTQTDRTSDADIENDDDSRTKKEAKSFAKTVPESFHIMVAGYNGAATPYTFTPPSSLVVAGNTLKHEIAGDQPSWASFYSKAPVAYVTGENEPGRVYAVNITKITPKKEGSAKTLSLKVLGGGGSDGGALTGGDGPVASCVARGILFVANYGTGSASALQLDEEGNIVDETPSAVFNFTRVPKKSIGPVASRQDHSYAHQVAADPSRRWVYVPDLGADMVHRLSVPASGDACEVEEAGSTTLAAGSGPRHIAFYRKKKGDRIYAYLASELNTTLTAFRVRDSDGDLRVIGEPISALPAGVDPGPNKTEGNTRTTSEVAVSPDGKFVYVGTRGDPKEDHVAVFSRNSSDGSVAFKQWYRSGGKNLRHFSLSPDPDALYLAAAHQNSGNVIILARNLTDGSLTKTAAVIADFEQVAFAGFFTRPASDL